MTAKQILWKSFNEGTLCAICRPANMDIDIMIMSVEPFVASTKRTWQVRFMGGYLGKDHHTETDAKEAAQKFLDGLFNELRPADNTPQPIINNQ